MWADRSVVSDSNDGWAKLENKALLYSSLYADTKHSC